MLSYCKHIQNVKRKEDSVDRKINTHLFKGAVYSKGFTMQQVANLLKMDKGLFYRKASGKVSFSISEALRVSEILGLTRQETNDIFMPSDITECKP